MRAHVSGILKWLYPGIGIKRWIALSVFGIILLVLGTSHLRTGEFWGIQLLDAVVTISGIIILILGIKRIMRSFMGALSPSYSTEIVDLLFQKKQLSRGPRIVAIGGGTGLSVLLTGLKEYTSNISAIVTVADDGGSSGRLRQEFDILPPGDIRNCLVALADAPTLMRDLFQFRFQTTASDLAGHSFGNLFITVMTRLTGDFEKAIKETSKVLALRGQVIPSSLNNVVLSAQYKDGSTTIGENKIPKTRKTINKVSLKPEDPQATPDAIKAIKDAQIIVLGPGSLYTSIIPNLLIREITDAIVSSSAIKVYVSNVMTQPGESEGYSVSDHVKALTAHSHPRIIDYCLVNTEVLPENILKRYLEQGSSLVVNDRRRTENMGYRVIEDDLAIVEDGVVRHDPSKLARIILGLIEEI